MKIETTRRFCTALQPFALFALLALLALGTACSPGLHPKLNLPEDEAMAATAALARLDTAEDLIRQAGARDARMESFRHRPWARADVRSLATLEGATEVRQGEAFWRVAAADGQAMFAQELARLNPEQRAELGTIFGCAPAEQENLEGCLTTAHARDTDTLLAVELARLARIDGQAEFETRIAAWQEDLRPSIKSRGRTLRRALTFPAFPFVYAWRKNHSAHEYEGPQWIDFAHARVFEPQADRERIGSRWTSEGASRRERDLLARYAPILVQEVDPQAPYEDPVDRIGSLGLNAENGDLLPVVDTDQPASYAYVETLHLDGQSFPQLVYTFWYPEHPKLKKGIDVEAGEIEGITLRITLDAQDQPALYETIYNCGCSHRIFVNRQLEAAARQEFGEPGDLASERPYAVQRAVDGKIDWIVPELVDFLPDRRPMLLVRAGFHMPAAVRFDWPSELLEQSPAESYRLRAYEELENLPVPGAEERRASLFTDTGVVRGAARLEGVLLTPLGLYRAGQPRQRGTQLIHFDQADFDDPSIYETYLRLPGSFFGDSREGAQVAHRSGEGESAAGGTGSGTGSGIGIGGGEQ